MCACVRVCTHMCSQWPVWVPRPAWEVLTLGWLCSIASLLYFFDLCLFLSLKLVTSLTLTGARTLESACPVPLPCTSPGLAAAHRHTQLLCVFWEYALSSSCFGANSFLIESFPDPIESFFLYQSLYFYALSLVFI